MTVVAVRPPPRPLTDDGNSQAGPTEHGRRDSHPCARSTRSSGYACTRQAVPRFPRERVRRLQRQAEETHKITRQHAQRGPISQPKRPATNSLRTPNTDPSMWVFGVLGRRSLLFEENSGYVSDLGPRLERGGRRTTASHQSRPPRLPARSPTSSQNPRNHERSSHPARQLLQPAIGSGGAPQAHAAAQLPAPKPALPWPETRLERKGNQVTGRHRRQLWLRSCLFPGIEKFSTVLGILRELTSARVGVTARDSDHESEHPCK